MATPAPSRPSHPPGAVLLPTFSLTLPAGRVGVGVQRRSADGVCVVATKPSGSSSPLCVGDHIVKLLCGVELRTVPGGARTIRELFRLLAFAPVTLVVHRPPLQGLGDGAGVPAPPPMPGDRLAAAKERVSRAEARFLSLSKSLDTCKKELKEAREYLRGLVTVPEMNAHDDENHGAASPSAEDGDSGNRDGGNGEISKDEGQNVMDKCSNDGMEEETRNEPSCEASQRGDSVLDDSSSPQQPRPNGEDIDHDIDRANSRYCHPVSDGCPPSLSSMIGKRMRTDDPAQTKCIDDSQEPPKKTLRIPKKCIIVGCTNHAKRHGVCVRHGARSKACSHPGCSNAAQNGGVCRRHGSKPKACKVEGCTTAARKGGLCRKHGGLDFYPCKADGCNRARLSGGFCRKHSGYSTAYPIRLCRYPGCKSQDQKGGLCKKHGANLLLPKCSVEGCTTVPKKNGLCFKHGGRTVCSIDGCTSYVQYGGLCYKHGAKPKTRQLK